MVRNLPAMWGTWVWSLGWEDPLEEGIATHSSILAWRIPMHRGAWWATVHGLQSRTWLNDLAQHIYISQAQASVHILCQLQQPLHSSVQHRGHLSGSSVPFLKPLPLGLIHPLPQPVFYPQFFSTLKVRTKGSFFVSKRFPRPPAITPYFPHLSFSPLHSLLLLHPKSLLSFHTGLLQNFQQPTRQCSLPSLPGLMKSFFMLKALNHSLLLGNHSSYIERMKLTATELFKN